MNIFQPLTNTFASRLAIIDDQGVSITYSDLNIFLTQLNECINKRSLVFCLCQNTIGSLCGYFSFISNKIVPLMLDASTDQVLLNNLLNIYRPNYLWVPNSSLNNYINNPIVFSKYNYSLILLNKESIDLNDQIALLLTTSGSTGSPKLVRLSYENILANAESIAQYLQITEDERPVTSLPMYYSYGLSVINSHLIKGATILLTDKSIAQKEFWSFAKGQKATSIAGVPYTYEMLKRLRFNRMDLPDLKTLTQAGGKLSPDLVKEFVDHAIQTNRRFYVMYGQTEATARMSYLPFEKAQEKHQSMGIAIPGGNFSLLDEEGNVIEGNNIDGELIYKGKNVSLGYAKCREDLSRGDDNNYTLHSGDIARRDSDGFYYITGRKKRFIKIYGNRVNLDAAEQIVKAITPTCACVGSDDKLITYVTDGSLNSQIKNLLTEKTGLNNRAFEIRVIPEIPKNGSGKILYAELKCE